MVEKTCFWFVLFLVIHRLESCWVLGFMVRFWREVKGW